MFSAGAAGSTEKYVSDWPKERQPQLAGHYKGYVRDWMNKKTACEYKSANLHIQANNRYSLSTRCDRGKGAEEVVTGSWWIDEIAGSCLILMREPPLQYEDENWYGFRIEGDAVSLSQDGGQCTAADERDNGMILRRATKGKT
jgi:hypothetical protein